MNKRVKLSTFVIVATLSLLFQNCSSNMAFNDTAASNEQSGDLTTPVTPPGNESNVGLVYPKLKIEAQPCSSGDLCELHVNALEPVTEDFSAKWATNDTIWTTQSHFFAQPGLHYVSASGHFTIKKGDSKAVIRVSSINWENKSNAVMTANIALNINQCTFKGLATPCMNAFR